MVVVSISYKATSLHRDGRRFAAGPGATHGRHALLCRGLAARFGEGDGVVTRQLRRAGGRRPDAAILTAMSEAFDMAAVSGAAGPQTLASFRAGLAEADPDVAAAIQRRADPPAGQDRADRLGEHRLQGGAGGAGLGPHQQICRRLSRPALLRRLRICRCCRRPCDRAGQGACSAAASPMSSRIPAPRPTRPCSWRCCSRAIPSWACPGGRRPSDPWLARQPVRQMVQAGLLWRAPPGPAASTWTRSRRLAREHKPKLIIAGGSAYPRFIDFTALPRDRRRGRRLSSWSTWPISRGWWRAASIPIRCDHAHVVTTTTHKTLRGPRGGMILSQRRRPRQEDQFGDLPGPAGRPADACDRRQGRGLRRGAAARVQALCQGRGRERQGAGRDAEERRARYRLRRHRHPSDAGRSAAQGGQGPDAEQALDRANITSTRTPFPSIRRSRRHLGHPAGHAGRHHARLRPGRIPRDRQADRRSGGCAVARIGEEGDAAVEASVRERVDALCRRFPIYH